MNANKKVACDKRGKQSNIKSRSKKAARSKSYQRGRARELAERDNYQDAEAVELKDKFRQPKLKRSASNDPQWYFKDQQILKDVANFSFMTRLGSANRLTSYYGDPNVSSSQYMGSVPGLVAIELALCPGISEGHQDPVNLAATNVYSYVRYKNSGGSNYDSPDLMMYLLSMDSIYACWNWMKRIYGLASTYSQTNKYMPKALVMANNVDFEDILENLADFRAFLNIKANEISAFCVPSTMSINVRHSWLFSNVYMDSETNKAQLYMYVPSYFYKYDEYTSSKGGQLIPQPVWLNDTVRADAPKFKFKDLKNLLNGLLEAVNYSEDIGIMSGDILKAYGEGGLFTVSTFDADYKVEPVYSKEVLSQIENATILTLDRADTTFTADMFKTYQDPDTNDIKFNPTFTPTTAVMEIKRPYLNFHWNDPTPEDVMVATRLQAALQVQEGGSKVISCGSELALDAYAYVFGYSSDVTEFSNAEKIGEPQTLNAIPLGNPHWGWSNTTDVDKCRFIARMLIWSSFDWHPPIPIGVEDTKLMGLLFDFDKFTNLDMEDVAALNLVALLTEFNVPN